jgi:hypothetical protein
MIFDRGWGATTEPQLALKMSQGAMSSILMVSFELYALPVLKRERAFHSSDFSDESIF